MRFASDSAALFTTRLLVLLDTSGLRFIRHAILFAILASQALPGPYQEVKTV